MNKINSKPEQKEFDVEAWFKPTAENAIRDMGISKLFFLTKDGKPYSSIANEYIAIQAKYAIYCKEEQENWITRIKYLISLSGQGFDDDLASELWACEKAGEIMEALADGKSWEEISEIVRKQGHTGSSISLLGQYLLQFSPQGIEFCENVIGSLANSKGTAINDAYKKAKRQRKKEEQKELQKALKQ